MKICAKLYTFWHLYIQIPLHILANNSHNITTDRVHHDLHICVWSKTTTVRPKFVKRTRPMVAISHTIPTSSCFSFLLRSFGPKTGDFYPNIKNLLITENLTPIPYDLYSKYCAIKILACLYISIFYRTESRVNLFFAILRIKVLVPRSLAASKVSQQHRHCQTPQSTINNYHIFEINQTI